MISYPEVRIVSQNWESAIFGAWILQIVLTELLHVPVSIEGGTADTIVDFYHLYSRMDYGPDVNTAALETALKIDGGDCRRRKISQRNNNNSSSTPYRPCAHVVPELWTDGTHSLLHDVSEHPFPPLGALAEQYWFIPRFTAEQNASLVSVYGLAGNQQRTALAEIFQTPTTWQDYCTDISPDQCATPNDIAQRAPDADSQEGQLFFAEGLYSGHFRKVDAQDCDKYPDTCYGHFTDYPCGWTSFLEPMRYHHQMPLKSTGTQPNGGYSYSEMVQIWKAANATRSNVIMPWWRPEALYESFLGEDAEFTRVVLPPPTQECRDAQTFSGPCDQADVGPPAAACDFAPNVLGKAISPVLRTLLSQNPAVPSELWSPAYELIQNNYRITELEMGEILRYWLQGTSLTNRDKYGYDPREATCRWVVDHLDQLKSMIPDTYPRVLKEQEMENNKQFLAATVLALFVMGQLLTAILWTIRRRKIKVIRLLLLDFMVLIELGLLTVTVSALLLVLQVTDTLCAIFPWLWNVGYALALTPLLLRIFAINRLLSSGKQMQRVQLSRKRIWMGTLFVTLLVAVFCLVWTVVDTPLQREHYELTNQVDSDGNFIVMSSPFCASDYDLWWDISVTWQAVLLLFALVLAFMASRVLEDMNDTKNLSILILSHFFFLSLRVALILIRGSISVVDWMGYMSLIMTLDVLMAMTVFTYPKLLEKSEKQETKDHMPDLFLRTTIMNADITGFAGWSSVREPSQVFLFLEKVFASFDGIAESRKVFVVETIAETYVAATGIPTKRSDHAEQMILFAMDITSVFGSLAKELEIEFGPDTGDLALRVGIHTGAVTGGILKGKGARFQLFGDTALTARQMMLMGERGRIHVSSHTAKILKETGRKKWLDPREDKISILGHGQMQSYWIKQFNCPTAELSQNEGSEVDVLEISHHHLRDIELEASAAERKRRLVDWNVETLHQLLKQIIARRLAEGEKNNEILRGFVVGRNSAASASPSEHADVSRTSSVYTDGADPNQTPLDEVKEIIKLPEFDRKIAKRQKSPDEIVVPEMVVEQLRFFVTTIAEMYKNHPFHNFAHASHVVMSVLKHMKRIVAPADLDIEDEAYIKCKAAAALHDHTYGITSDPLTQFACVFSALIHDVDHPGCPNAQLIREDSSLAATYNNRSVAEQKSFSLAWRLLMQSELTELRMAICGDSQGMTRFRQLVINSVMATDLMDKELKQLRDGRWDKAFKKGSEKIEASPEEDTSDSINRKATIVIEHLIQASDVSHSMQHWEIYRQWNENLFKEMYAAYRMGRAEQSPADLWYHGELAFLIFTECGVFGISSDENLNYATRNRELWVALGQQITSEMNQKCEAAWGALEEKEISKEDEVTIFPV